MKRALVRKMAIALTLLVAILLSGCGAAAEPTAEPAAGSAQDAAGASQLAIARVSSRLSRPGQAAVTGHDNLQFTVKDGTSADSLNVIETLLAAQSTCAVFVAEKAAQELDVNLTGATARSVFDEREHQVRVFLDLPGADAGQVLELANHLRQRCPIYTTLALAESVDFSSGERFVVPAENAPMVAATITEFGRADVTAGAYTFPMDSVPPLDGPNERLNPLDMMLGGLAACSSFAYAGLEPSAAPTIVVEADFDPSGVRDLQGNNPRMQAIRVIVQTDEEVPARLAALEEEMREQCYLYEALSGTVNIDLSWEPSS